MASPTAPSETPGAELKPPRQVSASEALIDRRLGQTQRRVKGVDIAAGLLGLAVGGLAYLFLAAVIDHWLIAGGLGFAGRLMLFAGGLAAAGWYFTRRILPLLLYRINPIFAAVAIEQSRPALKNGLINLLFLRKDRKSLDGDDLSGRVYQGLQGRAAGELAQIDVSTTVDRSPVIHRGYVLVGVMAVCCAYLLLSPKNPLTSFGRVIWPWARIEAPTRVLIERIEPGNVLAFQGDLIDVSAEVRGLADEESLHLYYSTADGQSVNQAIPMTVSAEGYRHRCQFPPDDSGLRQGATYYLAAGDCRTKEFRIRVQTALSILVERVEYDYPEYTGIADRAVDRTGDVRAIEGTRVTIRAVANRPIQQATMEMDCDRRQRRTMSAGEQTAMVEFPLRMQRDDPTRPEYESYQIRFADPEGNENREPIRHRIEVIADVAPEIRLVDPPPAEIQLAVNGVLELRVRAEDRDFALRRVVLRAEREGRGLPIRSLLERRRPEEAHEGPFEGTYRFEPARLGLAAGDKVIYWAEAFDNREDDRGPAPNRAETPTRQITIVSSDGQPPPEENAEGSEQGSGKGPQDRQDSSEQPGEGQQGEGQGEQQPDESTPDEGPEAGEQAEAGERPQDDQQQNGDPEGSDEQDAGEEGASNAGSESDGQEGQPGPEESGGDSQQQDSPQAEGDEEGEGSESAGEEDGPEPSEADREESPQGEEQSGRREEPIDGDTNSGDVIEEVLEYLKEQEQEESQPGEENGSQGEPSGAAPEEQDAGQQEGGAAGEEEGGGSQEPPQADGPGAGNPSSPSDQESEGGPESDAEGEQSGGSRKQGEASGDTEPAGGDRQESPEGGQTGGQQTESAREPKPGEQTEVSEGSDEPRQEKGAGESQPKPDVEGSDPTRNDGPGGGGKQSENDQGTPPRERPNETRDRGAREPDQTAPDEGDSPQSPSNSQEDSSAEGETSGNQSGGGEEGGGQKSEQSGKGTAGTHTAADEGAAAAGEQGEGETGTGAGDQVESDRPTGQSATQEQGPGSRDSDQPGGESPGGTSGEKQSENASPDGSSDSSSDEAADSEATGPQGAPPNEEGDRSSGKAPGGGEPGDEAPQEPPEDQTALAGEDANLDYARRRTDLALETLADQLAKQQPDPELLDRLGGWSREDLQRFVEQWEAMKRAAAPEGPKGESGRRKLDESLRSLGLRPRGTELLGGGSQRDEVENVRDSRRFDPPSKWAEQYRAYTKSIAGDGE